MLERRLTTRAAMRPARRAATSAVSLCSVYIRAAITALNMSDSEEEELILCSSGTKHYLVESREREYSAHPINAVRDEFGEYHHLYKDLREHPIKFAEYMRMEIGTFDYILANISEDLQKNWGNCHRLPISQEERLMITLRYLSTGQSFRSLAFSFRMGVTTVSKVIGEVLKVIWKVLQPRHMKTPDENDFRKIADDFYNIWNFPNCIGSIDGKHVRIVCPSNSGSMFYNYKQYFSIVLQGVVDANYKFITIDVGGYGKQSDDGTFQSSSLFLHLSDGQLRIPTDRALPNSNITAPFVMLGDEAYPLLPHLLKPYSRNQLDADKTYFNYRLSRARRTVECAFGLMYSKWRILGTAIQTAVDVADDVVKCICLLHNVIIDKEGVAHNLKEVTTSPPTEELNRCPTGRPNQTSKNIRDLYKMYMCQNPL